MMHRRIASASSASRRSSPTIPIRTSPSPTAASSGCRTRTRRASRYPYSTRRRSRGLNYIRNSIKVTIDAYDGTTIFHLVDPTIRSRARSAGSSPACSSRSTDMPEDLRTRLRYPQEIFAIQAAMFATFHMTNPAVFYNREDQWEIPVRSTSDGQAERDADAPTTRS